MAGEEGSAFLNSVRHQLLKVKHAARNTRAEACAHLAATLRDADGIQEIGADAAKVVMKVAIEACADVGSRKAAAAAAQVRIVNTPTRRRAIATCCPYLAAELNASHDRNTPDIDSAGHNCPCCCVSNGGYCRARSEVWW